MTKAEVIKNYKEGNETLRYLQSKTWRVKTSNLSNQWVLRHFRKLPRIRDLEMELKIFLTDLNKYNDGQLFGEWIDVFDADLSRVDDVVVISGTNGVYDLSDLGYEMAEMMDLFHDCPETLERYFDFEAYGRDIDLEVNGFFEDGCYYYLV